MNNLHMLEQMNHLRYQELVRGVEEHRRTQALLPPQSKLSDRLLYYLATLLIAVGQALHNGARGSVGVLGLVILPGACSIFFFT
jgi:hypothetical protein